MARSSLVQCERCGYENFPQHSFCGMCGAGLRPPGPDSSRPIAGNRPTAPARQDAEPPVSGPSFLGLGSEPTAREGASYLLEDDRGSGHRGRYLVLILLIAAISAAAWHRHQDLAALAAMWSHRQSSAASQAAPAVPASTNTQVEQLRTGDLTTTTPSPTSKAPTSTSSAAVLASAGVIPTEGSTPAPMQSSQPERSERQASAGPDESSLAQPTTAATRPTVMAASSETADHSLEAEGERYLYGTGVPQNCARAQSSLLTAAQHSDAKAQSMLGTMYATGHCVSRDLPLSYLWFSRAFHQDPSNARVEQDLRIVWNQMTSDERQMALRSGP